MNIVIQCAGSKRESAAMMKQGDGSPVMFVADSEAMPRSREYCFARPDAPASGGES